MSIRTVDGMTATTPASSSGSPQLPEIAQLHTSSNANGHKTTRLGLSAIALMFALASCGSGSDQAASTEVATLSDNTNQVAETETVAEQDTAEVALEFTQCMRDNGVEIDDPTFDADGNIEGGLGFGGGQAAGDATVDPRSEEFQTAITECGSLIEDLDFGGGNRGGIDQTEVEAALLTYTACLRDEGLAVDDITIGGDRGAGQAAGGGQAAGTPPADGEAANGEGGFAGGNRPAAGDGQQGAGGEGFDPTARLVEQLGLDQDDPEVAAALESCAPQLEAAFTGAAGGADAADAATEES